MRWPHLPDWQRRIIAYGAVVLAGTYGLYQVGPAADHRQCVNANGTRADIS